MSIPFIGVDCSDPSKDEFNYYLSQLRIHVEMAFGRLVNMFRILSGKYEVCAILIARARLHIFIIQHDRPFGYSYASVEEEMDHLCITTHKDAPYGMSFLPVVPNKEFEVYGGISYTREVIVEALHDLEFYRPAHNIERRHMNLRNNRCKCPRQHFGKRIH